MEENMVLVMIEETGEEIEVERFTLRLDLDEDELQVWEDRKIRKAAEEFPEARGFYFEDRRHWKAAILADIREWL